MFFFFFVEGMRSNKLSFATEKHDLFLDQRNIHIDVLRKKSLVYYNFQLLDD